MRTLPPACLSLGIAVLLATAARAELVLGTPFRDGAILQRNKPVPVWGRADPGEKIAVDFSGRHAEAVADAQGRWQAALAALPASDQPSRLVVAGKQRVAVENVLVGDVWLCSGQSNMFFYVRQGDRAAEEIASANHPLLRQFLVKSVVSDDPQPFVDGEWQTCSPDTVPTFTAVGYFFARDLQHELHVPIGIIRATLGGSPVEGWLSASALASDRAFGVVAERWAALRATLKEKGNRNQPGGLYNGLIYPLEPFALAGFLWYQGEGNAERATEYARLFRAMITQWRADFRQTDLPFLFVQLPGYEEPRDVTHESWAWERENQAAALSLAHTGMAVALDLGDAKNIHPTNKQDVGHRLAQVALHQVYGRPEEDSGPVYQRTTHEGAAMRVTFAKAGGLRLDGDPERMFLIAGEDRKFVPATAKVDGESVLVSAVSVPHPVAVRFEWMNMPTAFLRNRTGLPAAPFRTDNWLPEAKPGRGAK
jgi:sialate O-acetylesterase